MVGVGWVGVVGVGVGWGGWGGGVSLRPHFFIERAFGNELCAWNAQVHPSIYIYIYIYIYICT